MQPLAQQLEKEVVEAEPVSLVVQRHQEEIRRLQPLDKCFSTRPRRSAIGRRAERIAQARTEAVYHAELAGEMPAGPAAER